MTLALKIAQLLQRDGVAQMKVSAVPDRIPSLMRKGRPSLSFYQLGLLNI